MDQSGDAEEVDVVVLGLGPGGEEVAGRLASAGLDVVGVERGLIGGECPYWGCVPTKMMVRASDLVAESRRAGRLVGSATTGAHWLPVADRVSDATDGWDDTQAVKRLGRNGGRLRRGEGRLVGPGQVEVDGVLLVARRAVVVATGARPVVPDVAGLADTPFWTNRDAVRARRAPESLLVLGGGAIGVELGQVFRRFGTEVTLVESGPRLVATEEPEAGDLVTDVLRHEGVDVRTGTEVTSVYHDGDRFTVLLAGSESVAVEALLVATGRRPDLRALGVAVLGLDDTADHLEVDGVQRVVGGGSTWAVGDVTGVGAYTHVAMAQADTAVRDILGAVATAHADGRDPPGDVHRSRGRSRGPHGGRCPPAARADPGRAGRPGRGGPRLDPRARYPWPGQSGRGRLPGCAGGSHGGRPERWGGPGAVGPRRARRGPGRPTPRHGLRIPDLPPARSPRLSVTSTRRDRPGRFAGRPGG